MFQDAVLFTKKGNCRYRVSHGYLLHDFGKPSGLVWTAHRVAHRRAHLWFVWGKETEQGSFQHMDIMWVFPQNQAHATGTRGSVKGTSIKPSSSLRPSLITAVDKKKNTFCKILPRHQHLNNNHQSFSCLWRCLENAEPSHASSRWWKQHLTVSSLLGDDPQLYRAGSKTTHFEK